MYLFKFIIKHSKRFFFSLCLISSIQSQSLAKGFPNEYYEINDLNESKNYFFNHMYRIIENENNLIKKEREFAHEKANGGYTLIEKLIAADVNWIVTDRTPVV